MTHHDLADLLRDHVAHDEPPAPLPQVALANGRRRLRTRRLSAAGAALAALVVAGAVVVRLGGDSGPDSAVDPASEVALQEYDAHRMPDLMDGHVRRVLVASVPDLGPSRFTAMDSQGQRLTEPYWDKASVLAVAFGDSEHGYQVTISQSKGEAEGDPDRYCRDGLEQGYFLDCTVERRTSGEVVISILWAIGPDRYAGLDGNVVVTRDQLEKAPVDTLTFERSVKVIKSGTLVTYVAEDVSATSRDPATAKFVTPVDDLIAIGSDPDLVMPLPPVGQNGCPQWSLPASEGGVDVSCGPNPE